MSKPNSAWLLCAIVVVCATSTVCVHGQVGSVESTQRAPVPETMEQVRDRVHRARADLEAMEKLLEQGGKIPEENRGMFEKLRHFFSSERSAESKDAELKQRVADETERSRGGILNRLTDWYHSGENAAKDAAAKTGHAAQGAAHRASGQAAGIADTAREKLSEAAQAARDKAYHAGDVAREKLAAAGQAVKDKATETAERAREKVMEAGHRAREKAAETADAARARVESAGHAIKEKLTGAADQAKDKAEQAQAGILHRLFGAGEAVKEKAEEMKENVVHKVREVTGAHEPTMLERAKEKIGHMFGREPPSMTEQAAETLTEWKDTLKQKLDAVTSAAGPARDRALDDLRHSLEITRKDMGERAESLLSMLKGDYKEADVTTAKDDVHGRMSKWYSGMTNELHRLRTSFQDRVKSLVGRSGNLTYLYQASHSEDGLHMNYVNDAGHEYLDVSGEDVEDKKFDRLSAINAFRRKFGLEERRELGDDVNVQIHRMRRPHVLLKATRVIGDKVVHYTNDDGEEVLKVVFLGEPHAYNQAAIIDTFRQSFGLKLSTPHHNIGLQADADKGTRSDRIEL